MALLFEAATPGGGWRLIDTIGPADPAGSVSDNHDGHRDVIHFACNGDRSAICESDGADYEDGVLLTAGLRELAVLKSGESYERTITTDKGLTVALRWTHAEGGRR